MRHRIVYRSGLRLVLGSRSRFYKLRKGRVLEGEQARYVIERELGSGAFGITYRARIIRSKPQSSKLLFRKRHVVIKIPSIDLAWPLQYKERHIAELRREFDDSYNALLHLGNIPSVARLLDHGTISLPISDGRVSEVFFLVQELVHGDDLAKYLLGRWGHQIGRKRLFTGIRSEKAFFDLAHNLLRSLLLVHQRGIIHGDIWPANILMRRHTPILIDFGQGIFRDYPGMHLLPTREHPYLAPERRRKDPRARVGTWYVTADIYSLGGVLFFMATGQKPPTDCGKAVDDTKELVSARIMRCNSELHSKNRGVADVIARCLRREPFDRSHSVQEVLHDLELFAPGRSRLALSRSRHLSGGMSRFLEQLASSGKVGGLFLEFLGSQCEILERDIEDMRAGVYDLHGGPHDFAMALSRYLSVLKRGDRYVTLSTPSFWYPGTNLGINGRFLSMNYTMARLGIAVRRVFVVGPSEFRRNARWRAIALSHARVARDLKRVGVDTEDKRISGNGYYTGVVVSSDEERRTLLRRGLHCGVWERGGERMIIQPVYGQDGRIVTIQFRRSPALANDILPTLNERISASTTLRQYLRLQGVSSIP